PSRVGRYSKAYWLITLMQDESCAPEQMCVGCVSEGCQGGNIWSYSQVGGCYSQVIHRGLPVSESDALHSRRGQRPHDAGDRYEGDRGRGGARSRERGRGGREEP